MRVLLSRPGSTAPTSPRSLDIAGVLVRLEGAISVATAIAKDPVAAVDMPAAADATLAAQFAEKERKASEARIKFLEDRCANARRMPACKISWTTHFLAGTIVKLQDELTEQKALTSPGLTLIETNRRMQEENATLRVFLFSCSLISAESSSTARASRHPKEA